MKNLTIWLVLAAILGFAVYYFWMSPTSSPTTELEETVMDQQIPLSNGDRYVIYTEDKFEEGASKRRVLYFYANWCPTCRPTDASLRKNENLLPEDVVIYRVNYNDTDTDETEKALASKYAITYQHTFVLVDSEGNEVKTWNEGDFDRILENLQ